jgi:hypothetical protein
MNDQQIYARIVDQVAAFMPVDPKHIDKVLARLSFTRQKFWSDVDARRAANRSEGSRIEGDLSTR